MLPCRQYLLWFAQEHVHFRRAEIESLLALFNISFKYSKQITEEEPFWIVESNENDVKRLASRSVSLKSCIELWATGTDTASLHKYLKEYPHSQMEEHFQADKTFKVDVETYCKHISQKEKVDKVESFDYLPVRGKVNLSNPDVCLQYIEYYGTNANNPPEEPILLFFGRLVCLGLRQLINKLSLKKRKFIGNTSMDAQLSLLMANQAKVKDGDLVLDPFVGTGSLLVAAAQFGGYVLGTDIDYLMLHGRTRPSRISQQKREDDENVRANMKQYGLEDKYIDVLVNDFAVPFWKEDLKFDSIITDPPYGIREATERIGTNKESCVIKEEHLETHIPAKVEYGITNIYCDLLQFAAKRLTIGGRLVCWFPIFREDYSERYLPTHPCLQLISNSEQTLSKYTSRRLLTYEKIQEFDDDFASSNHVVDFRRKYFEIREETRKERRMKKAILKEKGRLEALERKKGIQNKESN